MPLQNLSALRRKKQRRTKAGVAAGVHRVRHAVSLPVAGISLAWWLAAWLLFQVGATLQHTNMLVGERSRTTLVSAVPFECPDLAGTDLLKRQAADAVLPVFAVEEGGMDTATRAITKLFSRLQRARIESSAATNGPTDAAVSAQQATSLQEALHLLGIPLSAEEALSLAPSGEVEAVQTALIGTLRRVWYGGIVTEAQRTSRFDGVATQGRIQLQDLAGGIGSAAELQTIPLPEEALASVVRGVQELVPDHDLPAPALQGLCRDWVRPNLRYQRRLTEERRIEAQKAVEARTMQVPVGTTLVAAGERITPQILTLILAHEHRKAELQSGRMRLLEMAGHAALLGFAILICGALLRVVAPRLLHEPRCVLMLAAITLLTLAMAKGLLYAANQTRFIAPSFVEPLVPLAFAPLLAALLVGGPAPLAAGLLSTLSVSLLYGQSYSILFLGLAVTLASALAGRSVLRRSSAFWAALLVGLSAAAVLLAMAGLKQIAWSNLWPHVLTAILNGLICALMALALLPAFEWLFGVTSDITLLEYSDMTHPLLQRVAIEAPGTYHHSLMVANLAHSAASELGLHALLVRVCAYFHDVGKLTKPGFFIENISHAENPHDDLSPSMSALVIVSHVKEGVALAQKNKLPRAILDGIMQHHGTSLIAYFYHRAQQQAETESRRGVSGAGPVHAEDYRYPGPKPQTPEMGVLLLADSVEAASRSMQKPTPSRIASLVHDIVTSRIADGQLDACDLTLAQIDSIKRSFVFSLTNMMHGRIAYPKDEDRNTNAADKKAARAPEEPGTLLPVDDATRTAVAT